MKALKASTIRRYSNRRLARWIGDNIEGYRYDSQYDKMYKEIDGSYFFDFTSSSRVKMIMILSDNNRIDCTLEELKRLI